MLFQEKKKAENATAISGDGVSIRAWCTNSYNFRPCKRILWTLALLSLSLSLSPLHVSVSALHGRLRALHADDCIARKYTRVSTSYGHGCCSLSMQPIYMHFNVGSFNDLHNEVICFLSFRVRAREGFRAMKLESECVYISLCVEMAFAICQWTPIAQCITLWMRSCIFVCTLIAKIL